MVGAQALGYVGLSGSERVAVMPFGDEIDPPMPATRGRRRIGALLRYLDALEARGDTDLGRSVERFLARSPRPGLVVVISDFFDPGGFQKPLDRLLAQKHEPVLFQVLDREEMDPTPGQDVELLSEVSGPAVVRGKVQRVQHESDLLKNTLQVKVALVDPPPLWRPETLCRARFLGSTDTKEA